MKKLLLSAVAAAVLSADDTELQNLRAQMAQMEAMLKTMQAKIDRLEHAEAHASENTHRDSSPSPVPHPEHDSESALQFSVNLDAAYVSRSKKDEELTHLELPGIAHGMLGSHSHSGHDHATYNASEGFNLNYAEMLIQGALTPDLDADVVLHVSENAIEIEEAFFTAHSLPGGVQFKGGKFLSDFGYLNSQHHHEWDFSDMPLVYEAFLGNHGINEIGVQLQWTPSASVPLLFGIEALQGKNEAMFGQAAIADPYTEGEMLAASADQPSLFVGYVKTSADFGDTALQAGASWARGSSRLDHFSDETPYAFTGTSDLYGLDLTLRHRFGAESALKWQSEWLYRDMEGTQFTDVDGDLTANDMLTSSMHKKQAGFYTQLVYSPNEEWGVGARYDTIYQNTLSDTSRFAPENLEQYTAMVEYRAGEYGRYRLQYTRSDAFFNEAYVRQNIDTLVFSVNLLLGSHSDHSHD